VKALVQARALSDALFATLTPEAFTKRALRAGVRVRHRPPRRRARVAPAPVVRESIVPAQRWVRIPRGVIHLGLERDSGVLGWCNEFEGHDVEVPEFEIEARKTTNAAWLTFIEAGGYREAWFWNDEDRVWRAELDAPLTPSTL